ncbi:MAG: PAS domain-containing protein, partial [Oscillospiraceae bacterium]
MICASDIDKQRELEERIKQLEKHANDLEKQVDLYRSRDIGGAFSVALDDDFTLLYGNDKFYKILEYTPEEMLKIAHNKCRLQVFSEDYAMVKRTMEHGAASEENYAEWIMRIISGKNNLKYILCSGKFEIKDGNTIMNGVVVDITRQKKVEQALSESEERARIAIEVANVFTWEYDIPTHVITFKGKLAKELMGMSFIENV